MADFCRVMPMEIHMILKAGVLLAAVGGFSAIGAGALFSDSHASGDPAGRCGYYSNSTGSQVPRPCGSRHADATAPKGATARCRDGSWSWSQHPYARNTCSYHGGVESYQ